MNSWSKFKALSAAALGTTALAGYQVGLVVYFASIFDPGASWVLGFREHWGHVVGE